MSRPRSMRPLAAATLLLLALGAALLHACRDKPTEPELAGALAAARGSGSRYTLTIDPAGSTANGSVTSNRGGIRCTITVNADGVAVASGVCSQRYKANTVLTVTAVPVAGGTVSWNGCSTPPTEDPLACQVRMDRNKAVYPTFGPPPSSFALTVAGGAGGSGSVSSSPAGITCTINNGTASGTGCSATYSSGQGVTLTATASSGSYLKAWAGAGCDATGTGEGTSRGSCTLTMDQVQLVVVSFDLPAETATSGKWDAPIPWPAVAIHAHLLPNGTVMTWGQADHDPVLWDPASPTSFGSAGRPADFFCSGHAFLSDGRLLVAGGHSGTNNQGIKTAYVYDFLTNSWIRGPDMQNGRWYPTNTTLPTGEILTVSGGDTAQQRNLIPEVWQPSGTSGSWRVLSSAPANLPFYPRLFVAPDGRVFAAGPDEATYYLNTSGTGNWTGGPVSKVARDYGSAVMYDAGKILIVGGNQSSPTNTAEVIDLNAGTGASWRDVGSMSVSRRQLNATLLADGKVLVTGGTNAAGFNTAPTNSAVLAAELWDPENEQQWKTLGRMTHHRLYHSTALLLPDARVLSVGSGQPAADGLNDDLTAEIFSPPYLFKLDGTGADRPTITEAPSSVSYNQTFTVKTPDAASISKVTWIRLSSVTHAFNENQRMNNLAFSVSGTSSLSLTAPVNGNLAPPGHYMLFLVNSNGVPSVAKIIRIG